MEAVIRKAEVPGNKNPLPLPIMRDRFVKRCLFILKKSDEPIERANVLRQMSRRSMTLNSSEILRAKSGSFLGKILCIKPNTEEEDEFSARLNKKRTMKRRKSVSKGNS